MPSPAAANAVSLLVDLIVILAIGGAAMLARIKLRPPGVYGRRRGQLTDWWGHVIWACTGIAALVWVVTFA